jgi:signal transduction histidine kinase
MSREELERKVKERTEELNSLNRHLEEKVQERTKELTEANAHLQELDRVKSEFISIAAHQLRTPMTGIRWALVTLEKTELAPEVRRITEQAVHAVEYVVRLTHDLLNVSRIDDARFMLDASQQDIAPFFREIAEGYASVAEAKHINFVHDIPNDLPQFTYHAETLRIAFDNLLDNAFKYTPEHGQVLFQVSTDGNTLTVIVKDSGIGIPESEFHRVFTKFYRAENAKHVQTDGSGLGLYLSKKVLEMHGASIEFASIEGGGTTFTVTMPLQHTMPRMAYNAVNI